jgi:maltodextrin utilization protein YvdJ
VKNKTYSPIILLAVSVVLMAVSIALKSMFVIAGATGLVIGWILCIDKLISARQMSLSAKILFAGVAIGLPVFISVYMG